MITERANPKIEEERKAAGNAKAILGWLTPSNARPPGTPVAEAYGGSCPRSWSLGLTR
jgi:hypothetical protein